MQHLSVAVPPAQPPRLGVNVEITGFVPEVPVIRQTTNGISLAAIRVEVPRHTKSGETIDTLSIEAWGDLAEKTAQHIQAGEVVTIRARLVANQWRDSKGVQRSTLKLVAKEISR